MRFAAKFDRWLVSVLVFAAAFSFALPVISLLAPRLRPEPLWVPFAPLAIWVAVLPSTLPQYYELRNDVLFLRQGWRKISVPYAALVQVEPVFDSRSAGVFSLDRIVVLTQVGKRYLVAPAEKDRFMSEIAQRAPQLEWKGFALAMPLL